MVKDLILNLDDDLENLSKIIRDIFFHVKIKKRKIFCNWIGEISKNYANDLNWWVANLLPEILFNLIYLIIFVFWKQLESYLN